MLCTARLPACFSNGTVSDRPAARDSAIQNRAGGNSRPGSPAAQLARPAAVGSTPRPGTVPPPACTPKPRGRKNDTPAFSDRPPPETAPPPGTPRIPAFSPSRKQQKPPEALLPGAFSFILRSGTCPGWAGRRWKGDGCVPLSSRSGSAATAAPAAGSPRPGSAAPACCAPARS